MNRIARQEGTLCGLCLQSCWETGHCLATTKAKTMQIFCSNIKISNQIHFFVCFYGQQVAVLNTDVLMKEADNNFFLLALVYFKKNKQSIMFITLH